MSRNQYDTMSVMACRKCLSLKIIGESSFCGSCGCTNIVTFPNIKEWERLYRDKYGDKAFESKYTASNAKRRS